MCLCVVLYERREGIAGLIFSILLSQKTRDTDGGCFPSPPIVLQDLSRCHSVVRVHEARQHRLVPDMHPERIEGTTDNNASRYPPSSLLLHAPCCSISKNHVVTCTNSATSTARAACIIACAAHLHVTPHARALVLAGHLEHGRK